MFIKRKDLYLRKIGLKVNWVPSQSSQLRQLETLDDRFGATYRETNHD